MSMITAGLLGLGMLFPLLSLLTFIAARWTQWRTGRNVSAVLIPFVGPILLTPCVFLEDWSYWLIPVFWGCDLGTLFFLFISPWLISDWWRTSRFTCCLTMRGNHDIQSAVITLHTGGHYLLEKSWNRPSGSLGIVGLGETGKYVKVGDNFELTADSGRRRTLYRIAADAQPSFAVVEIIDLEVPPREEYSLEGWTLHT